MQQPILEIRKRRMTSFQYISVGVILFEVLVIGSFFYMGGRPTPAIVGPAIAGALAVVAKCGQELLMIGIRCYDDHLQVQYVIGSQRIAYKDITHYEYRKRYMVTMHTTSELFNKFEISDAFGEEDIVKLHQCLVEHGVADGYKEYLDTQNRKARDAALQLDEQDTLDTPDSKEPFLVMKAQPLLSDTIRKIIIIGIGIMMVEFVIMAIMMSSLAMLVIFFVTILLLSVLGGYLFDKKGAFIRQVSCYYDFIQIKRPFKMMTVKYEDIDSFVYQYVGVYAYDADGHEIHRVHQGWNNYKEPDRMIKINLAWQTRPITLTTSFFDRVDLERLVNALKDKGVRGSITKYPGEKI